MWKGEKGLISDYAMEGSLISQISDGVSDKTTLFIIRGDELSMRGHTCKSNLLMHKIPFLSHFSDS